MLRVVVCGLACALSLAAGAVGAEAPSAASSTWAPGAAGQTAGRHLRPDGRLLIAWLHDGTSADYRAQVAAMTGVSVVSPTWWRLDRRDPGALTDSADPAFVAWAHGRGLAVWPLLGNRIDPDLSDAVLRDPARRARLVASTVEALKRAGADGVNVDFENLHDATAPLLTAFVAELRAALAGPVVSVDVTAMTDSWALGNWSTAYDRPGLAAAADYVVLMAYDQHNRLRPGGPVAGLDWVQDALVFLLRSVPPPKVVLGVPLYARDWVDDPTELGVVGLDATLGMAQMAQRLAAVDAHATFDARAGQRLFTYVDPEGRGHRVWLEDADSLAAKARLVADHGLAGAAAWRAGFETPDAWPALDAALAAGPDPPSAPAPDAAGARSAASRPPSGAQVGPPAGTDARRLALGLLVAVTAGHGARLAARRRGERCGPG